jgi:hypothetical protein
MSLGVGNASSDAQPRICRGCAPPVIICGQNVGTSVGPGVEVEQFAQPGRYELSRRLSTNGSPRVMGLVPICQPGVTVTFHPQGVLTLQAEARTDDGNVAAIRVRARRPGTVRIDVTRPRADRTIIVVKATGPGPLH